MRRGRPARERDGPSPLYADNLLLELGEDVGYLHDQVIDVIDLYLGAGVLIEHHLLPDRDGDGLEDSLVVLRTRAYRHDHAVLRLFLRGLGNDNPAGRLVLAFLDLDEDAIAEWLYLPNYSSLEI